MQHLIIIAGASGTGKTTVRDYLHQEYHVQPVITHTTRLPRLHEKDGIDYYFENDASMQKLHLLEKVTYNNYQYGSSLEGLQRAWQQHDIAEIVLDTAGVRTYLQKLSHRQLTFIFLTVSDQAQLQQRMLSRGDQMQQVLHRINSPEYQRDLHLPTDLKPYAHVIVNDDWQQTKQQLATIMQKINEEN